MKTRRATCRKQTARGTATLALACGAALAATALAWSSHATAAAATAAAVVDANTGFAEFDRSMLAGGNAANLARFEHGNPVLPGIYNLDVFVNGDWAGRMDVRFAAPSPTASATPCVDEKLLRAMHLKPAASAAAAATSMESPGACVALGDLIPGAKLDFDMSTLRLAASVPQAFMGELPRGYVDPASWDAGVPAFLLNYNANSYRTSSRGQNQTSTYLGFDAGLNVGLWHFRQNSTFTQQSGVAGQPGQRHWQNINAFVRRDLPRLRAALTIGDSFTDGAVFDSFGIRGVQVATDDRMLPQSLRGYAPLVRGVAETNAKVTVVQNGVQIYQATVAPGPFVISDLYPTGYGGDLQVTVTEADGRQHTFSVPYASVAQLMRPGITRFDVAAGQLRDTLLQEKLGVAQAAVQHGFTNVFTGYAGVQGSAGYAAALVGGAFNTRFGAVAVDLTQARTTIPGHGSHAGQSFRVTYSKVIPETDTSLSVAAYRYSTSGFLSLTDAAAARDFARRGLDTFQYVPTGIPMIDGVPIESLLTPAQRAALTGTALATDPLVGRGLLHQRNRFTLTLSQRLGDAGGSLYANASLNDYWNRSGTDNQFQVGYNNRFRLLGYSLSVTRSRTPFNGYDNQVFITASLPLGSAAHAPNLSLNYAHSDAGATQTQATVSGTAGAWSQFSYGATAAHGSDGIGNAVSVNAGYRSPYAVFNTSLGKGSGYSQQSLSVGGAVVAHAGGITFGQPLGDTVALVYAPGATGANVINAPGVKVDRSGYALVPYLLPYQLDTIQIDPSGLPLGVQLDATSAQVAPYAGAVVRVDFKSKAGRALIARIRLADAQPAPFGAQVFDAKGDPLGVVGQGGMALLRGVTGDGQLSVQWKGPDAVTHACTFPYSLPGADGKAVAANAYSQVSVTCVAAAATGPGEAKSP